MSNLILPSLSFKSLDAKLPPLKEGERVGRNVKIAYNTFAYRFMDEICIMHHSTTIATLSLWSVSITPRGYTTSTTANRISAIMRDNGLWPAYYGIAIRQGEYRIITPDNMRKGEEFHWAGETFTMVAGIWEHTERVHESIRARAGVL